MYAEETIYYQFGAGVQTEVGEGETMTLGEDGAIIVGNIHQGFEKFTCSVGMVSDRTLMLGDIHPEAACGGVYRPAGAAGRRCEDHQSEQFVWKKVNRVISI